ncbi:polysaccharide pyruvyl transferase family protein [Jiangella sp. DSM 45060]|uniref:polysaccharide pyruvyl transferase family protein n=1 Tax=Jiangella sp. DSM 45060 TaxID=1798224 RepID=UPI00087C55DB|nr:polysaccharide pyruvyl transferase family protein [Jiangella sp. DSM 45060]SDT50634.1 Polysaccharide pyruvyl transferase [Jiangella sp. DSM 45060]
MNPDNHRPRVMAGGSLDVDNFGDLLFFLLTERYLAAADVVPVAPFGWNMKPILARQVHAYGPLLSSEPFDVIWTVGGEMGGSGALEDAYRISAPDADYERYERGTADERRAIMSRAMGDVPIPPVVHAYMPPHRAYPLNADAVTVLNSVGISHLLDEDAGRDERARYLRELDFVSVRDRESSQLLDSIGVSHTLAPDAIHAISSWRPPLGDAESDIALFQISKPVLSKLGVDAVAEMLMSNEHLRKLRLRVLMTGTWREGADSEALNHELIARMLHIAPGADVALIRDRHPFRLVDHISRARIVIGTSLHLRIVACAYAVPRVTLSIFLSTKPDRYARLWDPHMPYGVLLDDLDAAVNNALARAHDATTMDASANLTRRADRHMRNLAEAVLDRANERRA